MSITEIIDALERAPRQGAAADEPEGARFVAISETALNAILRELRGGAAERPNAEYFAAPSCGSDPLVATCRRCGRSGSALDEFTSPYTGLCGECSKLK